MSARCLCVPHARRMRASRVCCMHACMHASPAPHAYIACALHACAMGAVHVCWLPGLPAVRCGSNAAVTTAHRACTPPPVSASPNRLLQSHGFPLDATVACGDSGNDILMLSGRNLAVAVGNSQVGSAWGRAPRSVPATLLACRRARGAVGW